MDSVDRYNPRVPRHAWLDWLLAHDRFNLYEWFGGRVSVFHASFTVHDGTIWRENTWMGVSLPRKRMKRVTNADTILTFDNFEWTLSVVAGSYQRLRYTFDDQMAQHPYYKVWRPSGCKILCQIVSVYYSTRTPQAEIERLTSYDFSCFTRFNPCARVVDLLPVAEEWHLYDSEYESSPTVPVPKERPFPGPPLPSPSPCSNIPVWAQARDASFVLAIEAFSTKVVKNQENHREYRKVTKVRVVNSFKEPTPWLAGAIVNVDNHEWFDKNWLSSQEELIPGRRYIVFVGNGNRQEFATKHSPLSFDRCGLLEDTPETRLELEKGFAQNDPLNP